MTPNNIFCLPKYKFEEIYKAKEKIPDLLKECAFISINDTFEFVRPDSPNYLNLSFDDREEELILLNGEPCVLFNDEHAQIIKEFVEQNLNKKYWFIHCTMGQCRSGAIGDVLSEYFGINYSDFKKDNPQVKPNVLVKKILSQILLNQ